jgi:hypothetical protein
VREEEDGKEGGEGDFLMLMSPTKTLDFSTKLKGAAAATPTQPALVDDMVELGGLLRARWFRNCSWPRSSR